MTVFRRLACLLALVLVAVALPPAAQAATPRICTATPFRNRVSKRVVYRIPALVVTQRGTLLAFAERRRSTKPSSDISDTEIVLARSTDRGCHWSAPRPLYGATLGQAFGRFWKKYATFSGRASRSEY